MPLHMTKPIPPDQQNPDLRSLLHWAPSLQTLPNENTSVQFFNGDVPGDYVVIVEAISEDGRIGYQEKVYQVDE